MASTLFFLLVLLKTSIGLVTDGTVMLEPIDLQTYVRGLDAPTPVGNQRYWIENELFMFDLEKVPIFSTVVDPAVSNVDKSDYLWLISLTAPHLKDSPDDNAGEEGRCFYTIGYQDRGLQQVVRRGSRGKNSRDDANIFVRGNEIPTTASHVFLELESCYISRYITRFQFERWNGQAYLMDLSGSSAWLADDQGNLETVTSNQVLNWDSSAHLGTWFQGTFDLDFSRIYNTTGVQQAKLQIFSCFNYAGYAELDYDADDDNMITALAPDADDAFASFALAWDFLSTVSSRSRVSPVLMDFRRESFMQSGDPLDDNCAQSDTGVVCTADLSDSRFVWRRALGDVSFLVHPWMIWTSPLAEAASPSTPTPFVIEVGGETVWEHTGRTGVSSPTGFENQIDISLGEATLPIDLYFQLFQLGNVISYQRFVPFYSARQYCTPDMSTGAPVSRCRNGGRCVEGVLDFVCFCPDGWEGPDCSVSTDNCRPDSCFNGGRCVDGLNNYTCACPDRYTGRRCERRMDNCPQEECLHGGRCVTEDNGRWRCDCSTTDHWGGLFCEQDLNDCRKDPYACNSVDAGATCVDDTTPGAAYTCRCSSGWTGQWCDIPSLCTPGYCRNGGTCLLNDLGFPVCECGSTNGAAYTGDRCEDTFIEFLTDCRHSLLPCQNGGVCTNSITGSWACRCSKKWSGDFCEVGLLCDRGQPCNNRGLCVQSGSDTHCICAAEYYGENCEHEYKDFTKDCRLAHTPCQNGGECLLDVQAGIHQCKCPVHWTGAYCETADVCSDANPCLNGMCTLGDDFSAKCVCDAGWTGPMCETSVDDFIVGGWDSLNCLSPAHSCMNHGLCVKGDDGEHSCHCTQHWEGERCEIAHICEPNPCNGGECHPSPDFQRALCYCPGNQVGEHCEALKRRSDRSFLSKTKEDLEAPQSLVATELLSIALDVVYNHIADAGKGPRVFVSHQGEMKRDNIAEENVLLPTSTQGKSQKVDYKVDILALIVSEGLMKVVATCEYKPDKSQAPMRVAQRDMYATNTISLHRRPCIGVDIAGGNSVEDWEITAMAYFGNPRNQGPSFECSEMYCGFGLDALFSIAWGIYEAAQKWTDNAIKTEYRLGPVVAKHGERVQKAYYNAKFRKPNLEWMKTMLEDDTAETWVSEDKGVVILEMAYRSSRWHDCLIPTTVFADIMSKLCQLHHKGKTHGDIRLANLLHSDGKGYIIDCDFVHLKNYPCGLQKLTLDGGRHPDVNDAIDAENVANLEMTKEHDRFSLGKVMTLFQCMEEGKEDDWQIAIDVCKRGEDLCQIAETLKTAPFTVQFNHNSDWALLFETGPTPQKRDQNPTSVEALSEED